MILNTEAIKKFLSESSVVKPNILYPNLNDTIKLEHAADDKILLTKTNNNIFCTYAITDTTFRVEDEQYLVGERMLAGIAQTTASPTITIQQQDGLITITGNKTERNQYPVRPIEDFPATPQCTGEAVAIDAEALYCIKVAGNHISKEQKITAANFVHIGPNGIFATNNNNMVYYHQAAGLPEAFFGEDALQVLKAINGVTYSTHGNYDFITYEGFSYGIIASAVASPINYMPMLSAASEFAFIIGRQRLLEFCTQAGYAAKSEYPIGVLQYEGGILKLDHDDADFNIHANRQFACDVNGAACAPFKFSIKWLEIFLKNLPYDKLSFFRVGNHFKISSPEDEQYTGMYAGIN